MKYTLHVYHPNGYYVSWNTHLNKADERYDLFETEGDPIKEVVFWNRISKMQNGRPPIMPTRIVKWEAGQAEEIKFNPFFFKVVNWILLALPQKIRTYRPNWQYLRFFGM